MTWTIVATNHFKRRAERFRRQHPELRQRLADTLRDLATDPYQPRLRLHSLGGDMAGVYAISVTYSIRVTLTLQVAERQLTLLNIGEHDDVYRQ